MKKALVFCLLAGLASCATSYTGKSSSEEVFETNKKASEAFADAQLYLAKYLRDSNHSIKVRDTENNLIAAKISAPCTINAAMAGQIHGHLDYHLELEFKDNRARLNLDATGEFFSPPTGQATIPEAKGQEQVIAKCMAELTSEIAEGISKKKNKDW